ncbi:MAG TPA: ABC transporter permease [Candidatus Thermoplasmatota archaeon]|nr:ABC transporter permease [Candidatus Thermoplasmatota archaeon]
MRDPARLAWPTLAFSLLLLVWAVASAYGPWPEFIFPPPLKVGRALLQLWRDGWLLPSLVATARRLALGFVVSLVVGALLGFVMARFKPARQGLRPYLLGLQSLPGVAWVPVGILWFSFSEEALLFVTIFGSVFAAALMFTDAIGSVPRSYLQAGQVLGARGVTLVALVAFPAALPMMVTAMKQTWAFAWRSLVGAELIFATVGLGFLLNQGQEFFRIDQVFGTMILTLFIGLATEVLLFAGAERWVRQRWALGS